MLGVEEETRLKPGGEAFPGGFLFPRLVPLTASLGLQHPLPPDWDRKGRCFLLPLQGYLSLWEPAPLRVAFTQRVLSSRTVLSQLRVSIFS